MLAAAVDQVHGSSDYRILTDSRKSTMQVSADVRLLGLSSFIR